MTESITGQNEAYSAIDRFLRNNLDDEEYSTYSNMLDVVWNRTPEVLEDKMSCPCCAHSTTYCAECGTEITTVKLVDTDERIVDLEAQLAVKTDECDGIRKLYEMLIKECYGLDPENYEDDGEYRYKWAHLAIVQAKENLSKLQQTRQKLVDTANEYLGWTDSLTMSEEGYDAQSALQNAIWEAEK